MDDRRLDRNGDWCGICFFLGLSSETLCGGLVVAPPVGGVLMASVLCGSGVVRIAGQELAAYRVALDIVGHGIILGLDWWVDIMLL